MLFLDVILAAPLLIRPSFRPRPLLVAAYLGVRVLAHVVVCRCGVLLVVGVRCRVLFVVCCLLLLVVLVVGHCCLLLLVVVPVVCLLFVLFLFVCLFVCFCCFVVCHCFVG